MQANTAPIVAEAAIQPHEAVPRLVFDAAPTQTPRPAIVGTLGTLQRVQFVERPLPQPKPMTKPPRTVRRIRTCCHRFCNSLTMECETDMFTIEYDRQTDKQIYIQTESVYSTQYKYTLNNCHNNRKNIHICT